MILTRCKTCCTPTTRPDTAFIDGECSACVSFKSRPTIDWEARETDLVKILEAAPRNGSGFDCIVPSSGGKDSTYQVVKLLELGARPLVVTASTCYLTPIGRRNIDNLARLATTVEITPNRSVRARLNRIGLEMVGDISWPEHLAIFSVPFRAARDFGIPLVFYGENPQREYGGPLDTDGAQQMTRRWVSEFGGLLGMRAEDAVGLHNISGYDMLDYAMPEPEDMDKISAYFLGQFIPWDSLHNAKVAVANGLETSLPSPANWWPAENLDNAMTGIHDFGMFCKYGYGRLCAQISVDVRHGRISRDSALQMVEDRDGLFPAMYAGVLMDDVLDHLDVTRDWVMQQIDRHTNKALFSRKVGSRPILKEWDQCLLAG